MSESPTYRRERMAGRMHAGRPQFRRKVEAARKGIRAMRELAPHSYASISFGKQSLCLADLLREEAPEVPFYFLASGESWIIHNYEEVIKAFCERHPQAIVNVVQTNAPGLEIDDVLSRLSPYVRFELRNWHPDDGSSWKTCRDRGDNDLQEMCDREEWDGWYLGLAQEESRARAITLSRAKSSPAHPSIYEYTDGKYRCCPLRRWTAKDVAAYVVTRDLPLLDAYKKEGLSARTTARLTKMSVQKGELTRLRKRNPDGYRRLCRRFPEFRDLQYDVPFARN